MLKHIESVTRGMNWKYNLLFDLYVTNLKVLRAW